MHTLGVFSPKGGPGKTTTCAHLAVTAQLIGGGPVVVCDTDPNGHLASWFNRREANDIAFASILEHGKLRKAGYELCIVDTPGAIDGNIAAVIALTDFVLIAAAPSQLDLDSAIVAADIIESAGKPYAFVITRGDMRTKQPIQMRETLAASYPTAPVIITHQPTALVMPMAAGKTAHDFGYQAAIDQYAQLWEYVSAEMRK